MRQIVSMIASLVLAALFISCSSRGESKYSDSSEELIENEIWNPFIILSREEIKIVAAKAEKMYKNLVFYMEACESGSMFDSKILSY